MKKSTLFVILSMITLSHAEADVGVGMAVDSVTKTIYTPIRISEAFTIEPSLSYRKYRRKNHFFDNRNYTTEELIFDIGFLGFTDIADNTKLSFGSRLGYRKDKTVYKDSDGSISSKTTLDGLQVAPTVGAVYFITDSLSLSAEYSIVYADIDGKIRSRTYIGKSNTRKVSEESTQSTTSVNIRYYF